MRGERENAATERRRPREPAAGGSTAVLAGCGDLGIRVGSRLARLGYGVFGLRRRPELMPAGFAAQAVDLRYQRPQLPGGTSLIVVALTADAHTALDYRDTYVTGLAHLLDAVDRDVSESARVLFVSSTSVYGITDGAWVDEQSTAVPASATGAQLRAAEQLLWERRPDAIVVRPAGLYGPRPGRMVATVRDGTATVPRIPRFTNRIHRDDAAGAIVHLCTRVVDPEPLYLGVDHEPAELGAVLRFIAGELGLPPPPFAAGDDGRGSGKRCRGNRLRETGFEFAYPTYRDGYRAILRTRP